MIHEGGILVDDGLDDLREKYSLALIATGQGVERDKLSGLEHCLAVRERTDGWHAIFKLGPEETAARLRSDLALSNIRCQSLPLEEMFIELVGGNS